MDDETVEELSEKAERIIEEGERLFPRRKNSKRKSKASLSPTAVLFLCVVHRFPKVPDRYETKPLLILACPSLRLSSTRECSLVRQCTRNCSMLLCEIRP
jgi:hypothetical protein